MHRTLFLFFTFSLFAQTDLNEVIAQQQTKAGTFKPGKSQPKMKWIIRSGNEAIYNKNTGEDVNFTKVEIQWVNKPDFSGDYDQIIYADIGFSPIPYLIEDWAEDNFYEILDQDVEEAEVYYSDYSRDIYDEQAQQVPVSSFIPEPAYNTLIDALGSTTYELIAQPIINSTRDEYEQNFWERKDHLQKELSLQEIFMGLAFKIKGSILIVQVGKFRIQGGPEVNADLQNKLEAAKIKNTFVDKMTTAAPMPAIRTALITSLGKNTNISFDCQRFHEAPAYVNAKIYLGSLVFMTDEQFEQHIDYLNLNSTMCRALFESKHIEFNISQGDFNSNSATLQGVTFNLDNKNSIVYQQGKSQRYGMPSEGWQLAYIHETKLWNKPLHFTVTKEHYKDAYNFARSFQRFNYTNELSLGTQMAIWQNKYWYFPFRLTLGAEYSMLEFEKELAGKGKEYEWTVGAKFEVLLKK